ncbi:biotin transport system substrate-specific component [Bacilli bacterium PM5-3]|nr:biotin transport system substrate-specific component [Bacilli bacterium PM5-3]
MKVEKIVRGAFFIVLFFIASNIIPQFQILGVPFTFQTLVILLVPFFFNVKDMIVWYISLLLLCLIGFPIMSGYSGGLSVFIGPSAGFIYGWLIKLLVIKLTLIYNKSNLIIIGSMIVGTILDLLIGACWLSLLSNTDIFMNIKVVLISFLPFGIVKVIIAYFIIQKIPVKYLENNREVA